MGENWEENDLRDSVFWGLNTVGYNPFDDSVLSMLKILCTIICHHLVTLGLVLELIFNFQGFDTIAKTIKHLPFLIMSGVRMWMAIIRNKTFKTLLLNTNFTMTKFYNKEIMEVRHNTASLVRKIFFIYLFYMLFIASIWIFGAGLNGSLFILTYKESEMNNIYWLIAFFVDAIYLVSICLTTSGLNGIFVFMVTHISTEMKMLNMAITDCAINIEEIGFNKVVAYHIHLLSLIKHMINVYALILLVEYSLNWGLLTFNIFLWTMDGFPDYQHTYNYGITALYAMAKLGYYSYSGDVIKEQCNKLSNSIFHEMTDYLTREKNKTSAIMMIHRSQENVTLTIGGYVDLNLMTFNNVSIVLITETVYFIKLYVILYFTIYISIIKNSQRYRMRNNKSFEIFE